MKGKFRLGRGHIQYNPQGVMIDLITSKTKLLPDSIQIMILYYLHLKL